MKKEKRPRIGAGEVFVTYAGLRELGIPFSRVHIRRLELAGKFPRSVLLGDRSVAWRRRELDEWINARPRSA
jgi:prophage regulatory protein